MGELIHWRCYFVLCKASDRWVHRTSQILSRSIEKSCDNVIVSGNNKYLISSQSVNTLLFDCVSA